MDKDEFLFLLEDRIAKIQAINEQFDLEHNSYISFSGGKDSTILHYLIDLALPNNHIPRIYCNTGIEYIDMVDFVKSLSKKDDRIIILNQVRNIKKTLSFYGYPFKSKEHSSRVYAFNTYRKDGLPVEVKRYLGLVDCPSRFQCPDKLRYQFSIKGQYNYSKHCCSKLKKELAHNWQIQNKKSIVITGMRQDEGGTRSNLSCLTRNNSMFHPLVVCSNSWEDYFIDYFNITLCKLYYPPYNFVRSGCKGCPYNLNLQNDLLTLKRLLPNEYKQCLHIWKPVYDEYIRLGYRLDKNFYSLFSQYSIYDFIEDGDIIKSDSKSVGSDIV